MKVRKYTEGQDRRALKKRRKECIQFNKYKGKKCKIVRKRRRHNMTLSPVTESLLDTLVEKSGSNKSKIVDNAVQKYYDYMIGLKR